MDKKDKRREEIRAELDKELECLKEDFFIRALEYARMKVFGATLEDGRWTIVCHTERPMITEHLLKELGYRAEAMLRHITIQDNEAAARIPKPKDTQ